MVEPMKKILDFEGRSRTIPGLKIARGVRRITHSQFVDDTLLIRGASKIIANHFKLVLDQYVLVSGGVINKNKCQIYAWNIRASSLMRITNFLQF